MYASTKYVFYSIIYLKLIKFIILDTSNIDYFIKIQKLICF